MVSINLLVLIAGCSPINTEDCPSFIEVGKTYELDMSLKVKVLEIDKKSCWAKVAYQAVGILPGDQTWINLNAFKAIKPE